MEIVVFLTKGQEGDTLREQGKRKGDSMRGLPDSAILGTYGRIKHMRHKKRHSAKDYQATADFLNSILINLIKKQEAKLNKLTKV